MSEFEIAYLFNEFLNSVQGRIETFLTGLFAMLATAHFVGPKLGRPMAVAVVLLFTLFSALIGFSTLSAMRRVGALVTRFPEEVGWLTSAAFNPIVPLGVLLAGGYVGAVWFFLQARRGVPKSQ